MKPSLRYAVVIERGERSYGATVPDLPGCFAIAKNLDELTPLIREAIDFHISGLHEVGLPIPQQVSFVDFVDVAI